MKTFHVALIDEWVILPGCNRDFMDLQERFGPSVAFHLQGIIEDRIIEPVTRYTAQVRPFHEDIYWWWMDEDRWGQ